MITLGQLNKICPSLVGVRGQLISDSINRVFPLYPGMTEKIVLNATLANLLHESGEFTRFEENLNYKVTALLSLFGRHRISENQCYAYGRVDGIRPARKEAIANTIYGGNWGKINLGNDQPGDGWNFRGSGGLQATGRKVFTLFTTHYNKKANTSLKIVEVAERLRDKANLDITMHFACWFVTEFKGIAYLAKANRFGDFCKAINGGFIGYEERLKYFNRGKIHL